MRILGSNHGFTERRSLKSRPLPSKGEHTDADDFLNRIRSSEREITGAQMDHEVQASQSRVSPPPFTNARKLQVVYEGESLLRR